VVAKFVKSLRSLRSCLKAAGEFISCYLARGRLIENLMVWRNFSGAVFPADARRHFVRRF
jgi:hypothetical protein